MKIAVYPSSTRAFSSGGRGMAAFKFPCDLLTISTKRSMAAAIKQALKMKVILEKIRMIKV